MDRKGKERRHAHDRRDNDMEDLKNALVILVCLTFLAPLFAVGCVLVYIMTMIILSALW